MSSRTRRTLVVTAPDGTEVTEQTSGGYDTAGIVQGADGTWRLVAHGWSHASVYDRTHARYNRGDNRAMHVGDLVEQTAPIVREYFGTHDVYISQMFTPANGWMTGLRRKAGRSDLRQLQRDGITSVAIKHGGRTADFAMDELVKSMNARKVSR